MTLSPDIAAVLAGSQSWALVEGDCLDVLRAMPGACVDAVVTDQPYGLHFMSKDWDHGIPGPVFWSEIGRVCKPGAHCLAFGGTRTWHRLACSLEDAGWELRDTTLWLYGQGFPKSLDVSKAIDKAAGAEREVLRTEDRRSEYDHRERTSQAINTNWRAAEGRDDVRDVATRTVTAPATPEAAQWDGWGTALKPAWEPILLCRKPLCGTVAANVTRYGTGALNIDGCRVGGNVEEMRGRSGTAAAVNRVLGAGIRNPNGGVWEPKPAGRWPANLVLSHVGPDENGEGGCRCVGTKQVAGSVGVRGRHTDEKRVYSGGDLPVVGKVVGYADADGKETVAAWECVPSCPVRMLDEQSGERRSAGCYPTTYNDSEGGYGEWAGKGHQGPLYEDRGGASRFFYTSKASRAERGPDNKHPTVKPLDLMRWLCRLITPPGGVVLDPFAGSGSTVVAALREGLRCIGIEREASYATTARTRIVEDEPLFRRREGA